MKKTTTLAVALLLVVATAFATETDKPKKASKKVAVINNSPEKFKLVYFDKTEGLVKVELKNQIGQTVHNTTVKNKEGFAQPYDLQDLPEGNYTFIVTEPNGGKLEQTIVLKKPVAEPNFAANVLKLNDGKKFRLAVVNKDKKVMPTEIKLYDENDNLILEEKVEDLYGFRRVYDLSAVDSNSFRFTISNKSGVKALIAD